MVLRKSMVKLMLCVGMSMQFIPVHTLVAEEPTVQTEENEQSVGILFSDEPVELELDFLPQAERYEVTVKGDSIELVSQELLGEDRLIEVRTLGKENADILIECINGEEVQQYTVHVSVISEESEEEVIEEVSEEEAPAEEDPSSFTITYDDGGGTFPAGYEKKTSFQEGDTIELPDLTKAGYQFLGWKKTGTEDEPATSYKEENLPAGDVGYTAVFSAYEYSITADYDGGEPDTEIPSSCSMENVFVLPSGTRPAKILTAYDVILDDGTTYTLDIGAELPSAVLAKDSSYAGSLKLRAVWGNDPDAPKEEDKLHFIHLGKGSSDGFLIESNGRYGLIDTSNPSSSRHPAFDGSKLGDDLSRTGSVAHLMYYLEMLGVKHLDFVIVTHAHSDHNGGVPELCSAGYIDENTVYIYKNYAVQVDDQENDDQHHWYNQDYFDDALSAVSAKTTHLIETEDENAFLDQDVFDSYDEALAYLGAEKISGGTFQKGFQFIFGDFTIRLYNMDNDISLSNENTNSFVTLITKGNKKALFMADMNVKLETEQKIVRNIGEVDIYKLGHHGYTKSTSFETLLRTSPEYVIIPNTSIGNNTSIYTVLKALGSKVYQTGDSQRGVVADLTEQNTIRMYNISDSGALSGDLKEWVPSSFNYGWIRNAWSDDEYNYLYMNQDHTVKYGWNNMSDGKWYYFDHTYGIMAPAFGMKGSLNDNIEVVSSSSTQKTYTVKIKDDSDTSPNVNYVFHASGYLTDTKNLPEKYRKTGWEKTTNGYCYWKADYNRASGWQYIDKNWYYFGADFNRVTGWQKISGKTYYFDKDGKMYSGLKTIGKYQYYFDTASNNRGALKTGIQKIGDKNYYFYEKSSGAECYMLTGKGWKQVGNTWYYLNSDQSLRGGWLQSNKNWYYMRPAMAVGWQKVSGFWYWFNSSGAMVTGWQKISNVWYWFNSSGGMITGWKQLSGKWYWFNSAGAMATGWKKISGAWYWFDSSGAMKTGWQKISNKWYWFNSSGAMVTGTQTIGGKTYKFDANGVWIG